MSTLKLTYYRFRGRAELARLVMAAAGQEWEEVNYTVPEWLEIKPGLYGSTNLECLMIDQILQLKEDVHYWEIRTWQGSDKVKVEAAQKLSKEVYPRAMKIYNDFIKQNPANSGFVVGSKLTLGDLGVFESSQNVFQSNPRFLSKFPEIMELRDKVSSTNGIKQYLTKRRPTPV